MLLYNHQKEFIGIDAVDLNKLGFSSLEELFLEVHDFADMFIKKPGFVHNFKHVNWIDFVECSDAPKSSKVLIHAKSRNFQCTLSIDTIYLKEEVNSKAFSVHLNNLHELTDNEVNYISVELLERSTPAPIAKPKVKEEIPPLATKNTQQTNDIPLTPKKPEKKDEMLSLDFETKDEAPLTLDLNIDSEDTTEEKFIEIEDNGYVFDPLVASDELGLPVDLIEEFIEDFIAQSQEFKDGLYQAFNDKDQDKLRILSHKLKGVAANLRIEDSLESLTIINTSDNNAEIKKNLDIFYHSIGKLSDKTISPPPPIVKDIPSNDQIDTLEFKEDTDEVIKLEIDDSEVPDKINLPELADDNFLLPIEEEKKRSKEIEEVEEIEEMVLEFQDDEIEKTEPVKEEINLEFENDSPSEIKTLNYDKASVAIAIGLDRESFNELFDDYLAESQENVKSISTAIEMNDSQTWKTQASKLKGMSNNMHVEIFDQEINTLIQTDDATEAQVLNQKIIESLTQLSNIKG